MSNLETKVDLLMRYALCKDDAEKFKLEEKMRSVMGVVETPAKAPVYPNLEVNVAKILREIGVPDHLKGHRYIKTAIAKVIEDPDCIDAITKVLYPHVAEVHNTTPSRVERAIRHAIEVAWNYYDLESLYVYFGNTIDPSRGKPTNSLFLASIANHIRDEVLGNV